MDQRKPLKDLTIDNVGNLCENKQVIEKFSASTVLKPRMSVIKAFDPLYESPLRFPSSQIHSTAGNNEVFEVINISNSETININSFDNENVNLNEHQNSSNVSDDNFINSIQEFAEGIIMEAINIVFPEETPFNLVNINDTFYETPDTTIILDNTKSVCNTSQYKCESDDDCTIGNSFISCTNDVEINDLRNYVGQLKEDNIVKDEELIKLKELLKVREKHVQEIEAENLDRNILNKNLEKRISDLEIICKSKDEHIFKLEKDYLDKEIKYEEELSIFKENVANNIEMQHNIAQLEKELETLKVQQEEDLNTIKRKINDPEIETKLSQLQSMCTNKDEYIAQLEESLTQKEIKFNTTMNAFEQHIEGQLSEIKILQDENSIAKRHLSNLEIAFNDLHQKYERSKRTIEGYHTNEASLQTTLNILKNNLKKYDEQVDIIKRKAIEQINNTNRQLAETKETFHIETSKLMTKIKHLDIKHSSLTSALEQKNKECQDLTNLYEEITGKGF